MELIETHNFINLHTLPQFVGNNELTTPIYGVIVNIKAPTV